MTDRPILFSAPMVRALLAGRKTQTRRIIKPQPPANVTSAGVLSRSIEGQTDEWTWLSGDPRDCDTWGAEGDFKTRFRPGDRLWVKETWRVNYGADWYREDLGRPPKPSEYYAPGTAVEYLADGESELNGPTHPSIFMTRWASRITLPVANVRVERLQECSEADAIAEGVERRDGCWGIWNPDGSMLCGGGDTARDAYRCLWLNINGAGSWEANPWVVAVSFSVVRENIDRIAAREAA